MVFGLNHLKIKTLFSGVLLLCSLSCREEILSRSRSEGDDAKGDSGTPSSQPTSGASAELSIQTFEKTLYPLVRKNCAQCHSRVNAPFFAADDVKEAHDAIIDASKINFDDPASSRIAKRPLENHNCWAYDGEIDCERNSKDIIAAV